MANKYSSLCISLLTELLDLNSLEALLDKNREAYAVTNIRTELGEDANLKLDIPMEDTVVNSNENGEKRGKKFHKRLIKSNFKESNNVFGGKLNENSVQIIWKIMEHLKDYTNVEGLFRISGNKRRQEDLKMILNKGDFVDFASKAYSQHDLTTILKQFFAELSEPIFTDSLYSCYKQVAGKTRDMDGKVSSNKRLIALQLLSLLLPPLNRRLLKKLIELLYLVSRKTVNLMSAKNLAVVFAPNIASKTKISCLTDYSDNLEPLTEIVEFLIENAEDVFKVPDELFDSKQKCKGLRTHGTPKVYCRQFDIRHYHQETVKTTNDALAELYAQVVDMPDKHPMKKQFLDDFKKKYPGTPPFIPKCRRETLESPTVSTTPFGGKRKSEKGHSGLGDNLDEYDSMFLSTPEKRRLFTEGELAGHKTPDGNKLEDEQLSAENTHRFDTIPEKRKRFRRPSFSRPSFGLFSKRSTPDLRKISNTPSSSANATCKRTRTTSASNSEDTDLRRRFSFTPFLDRKFSHHRSTTERKALEKSKKVIVSTKIVKNMNFDSIDSTTAQFGALQDYDMKLQREKKLDLKTNRVRPELRAPLIDIHANKRSVLTNSMGNRRKTLALHKEPKENIDAFRPRRETLAVYNDNQLGILAFKPRSENFEYEKGQPILESFKPKRDSLVIHKKCQPQLERFKCVARDIYEESQTFPNFQKLSQKEFKGDKENNERMRLPIKREDYRVRLVNRDVTSPVKFSTFGKTNLGVNQKFELVDKKPLEIRRMSTGSIGRSELPELKTSDDMCTITIL